MEQDINQAVIQDTTPIIKKHSKLGIASFIIAIVSALIFILAFVILIAKISDNPKIYMSGDINSYTPDLMQQAMIFGFMAILGAFIALVGFIIGIVGLFTKNVKKVFAILGTILNAFPMILIVILMIIGLSAQSMV